MDYIDNMRQTVKRAPITSIIILMSFVFSNPLFGQSQLLSYSNVDKSRDVTVDLSTEIIKDKIKLNLLNNFHEFHDEVILQFDEIPSPIQVNPSNWDVKISKRYGKVKRGANSIEVAVFSNESLIKKFLTTVRFKTFDNMVVAKSQLNKLNRISGDQVLIQRIESTTIKRMFFRNLEDVFNLQTKRIVQKGKPIFFDMVELPFLVTRGDILKIVVKLKNLEVSATGKALQGGRIGDMIKVENLSTRKKLVGTIQNRKTVLIEL